MTINFKKLCLAFVFVIIAPLQVAADKVTDVVNDVAAKLVHQLPMDKNIALKSLSPDETGLPEDFLRKLTSDLEAALLTASDFEINLENRLSTEEVWQEAVEFNNANFDELFKSANADVMLMISPRAISTGVEIAITAYALTGSNIGQTLASSGSVLLPIDLTASLGVDVNDLNKQMAQVLAEIEKVGQTGGLITNPTTYAEFYHNARLLQQRGEVDLALNNYQSAILVNLNFVDPILDFADLLKRKYGENGAAKYFEKKIEGKISPELYSIAKMRLGIKDKEKSLKDVFKESQKFSPIAVEWIKLNGRDFERNSLVNNNSLNYEATYYLLGIIRAAIGEYETGKYQKYFIDNFRAENEISIALIRDIEKNVNRVEYSVSMEPISKVRAGRIPQIPEVCTLFFYSEQPPEDDIYENATKWLSDECTLALQELGIRDYQSIKEYLLDPQNNLLSYSEQTIEALANVGSPANHLEKVALHDAFVGPENQFGNVLGPCGISLSDMISLYGQTVDANHRYVGYLKNKPPDELRGYLKRRHQVLEFFDNPFFLSACSELYSARRAAISKLPGWSLYDDKYPVAKSLLITDEVNMNAPVLLTFSVGDTRGRLHDVVIDVTKDGSQISPSGAPIGSENLFGAGGAAQPLGTNKWLYVPGYIQGSVGYMHLREVSYTDSFGRKKEVNNIFYGEPSYTNTDYSEITATYFQDTFVGTTVSAAEWSPYSEFENDWFKLPKLANEFVAENLADQSIDKNKNYQKPNWCTRAKSVTELTVCSNANLSQKDIQLSELYQALKSNKQIKNNVRVNYKNRAQCGSNVDCIDKNYSEIIMLLEQFSKQSASKTTCGIPDEQAAITNVENFTNFRRQAGLNGQVIGQVPLGATVSVVNPGNFLRTDRCAATCNGTNQNAIKQCIDNNDVWIEVEYNGRRGFLSRKFLE